MTYTIESLMRTLGCKQWPKRWNEFFDETMSDFDKNGCPFLKGEYYDRIHEQYGVLNQFLTIYKKAAAEVAENEPLARLFMLICRAQLDREEIREDIKEFTWPVTPKGKKSLGYDMLGGLAICAMADYCYGKLKARNVPKHILDGVMRMPETGVSEYMLRNEGKAGYKLFKWFCYAIDGELFLIERLEVQINVKIEHICVFQNDKKEIISFANNVHLHRSGFALGSYKFEDETDSWFAKVEETDDCWIGYPYDKKTGYVKRDKVVLKKSKWKKIIDDGDYAVNLHIPHDGKLTPESVDRTIAATKDFLKNYYPDYDYKCFMCESWMCDPQVLSLLSEDTNIAKFCRRFTPYTILSDAAAVFYFVYMKPNDSGIPLNLAELSENTTLESQVKKHYQNGKALYGTGGFFLK